MKRREFCRHMLVAGGAVALSPLIKGCAPEGEPEATTAAQPPTTAPPTAQPAAATSLPTQPPPTAPAAPTTPPPTAEPEQPTAAPATAEANVATVALVKTTDRAWGVQQAIALLGLNPVRGERVLLKPNYNSVDATPGSTHPDVLRSLLVELNNMGARSITLGERSGMGNTRDVLAQTGVLDMAGQYGFDTVVYDELAENEWVVRQPDDSHWASGFAVPRILLDSGCVVQTCNLKTHRYGGHFTLSLKNTVGLVAKTVGPGGYNYMEELHSSPHQRLMIAETNTVYAPALIVMDGVEAFVDGGPATGRKASPGLVLAATDRVAIDAVGVAILRLLGTTAQVSQGRVFEQEQIARAVELGLGVETPDQIRLVTADADSAAYAGQITPYLT